jgi:hypothetical protein
MMRKSFIFMLLLLASNSHGYFYYLCVAKTTINKKNRFQRIILLADYHDKTHAANKSQRAYLEALLKKYSNKKVKLIVEDLSSINNDGRMICCNFGINCAAGVLGHLANKARSLGIDVDNVEYRYCRVAGIGPLINNITLDPHTIRSASCITLVSLYKEIIDEINKIGKYDDGKQLNRFYKRAVAHVRSQLSHMKLCCIDPKKTVAHHCKQLKNGEYHKELEKLCIFDSALIDSNIMHAISNSDATIIFVVAGGSHIEQVSDLLKKMGYEAEFISPNNHQQPIDITVLDRLL